MVEGTRAKILGAATSTFEDKGYHGSGIKEILDRAGVPKGSFYHFFESKEHLAETALRVYAEDFGQMLANEIASDSTPLSGILSALEAATEALVVKECRGGCLLGSFSSELADNEMSIVGTLRSLFDEWTVLIEGGLKQAVAVGELPTSTDAADLAGFILNGWEGAVLRARLDQSRLPLDVFRTHLASYLDFISADNI